MFSKTGLINIHKSLQSRSFQAEGDGVARHRLIVLVTLVFPEPAPEEATPVEAALPVSAATVVEGNVVTAPVELVLLLVVLLPVVLLPDVAMTEPSAAHVALGAYNMQHEFHCLASSKQIKTYSFRSTGDGVATRQLGSRVARVFLWEGILGGTLLHLIVCVHTALEDGALFDHTAVSCTDIQRLLQVSLVPTVLEITVKTEASGVAVGEHELAGLVQIIDRFDIVPDFVKDGHQSHWMRSRAIAAVDTARISHVALVVRTVEVLSVPATWEEDYQGTCQL